MRTQLLVTSAALCLAAACSQPNYAHFGDWTIGKTTLKDASGRCEPTEFANGNTGMFCFGQRPAHIGEQSATVDLYFGKNDPGAPLIELQYTINACKTEPLEGWLRTTLGQPKTTLANRLTWEAKAVLALADLPSKDGKCKIRLLPPSERAEFARLVATAP